MAEESVSSVDVVAHGGLDEAQARAVQSEAMPLCVLAGAGSGKSRVLVRRVERRIADGSASPEHTLVLTFTRKAAEELRVRLLRQGIEGVTTGTFHAVALAQLRQRYLDAGKTPPAIVGSTQKIVQSVLERLRLDRSVDARRIVPEIGWAKSCRLDGGAYQREVARLRRRTPVAPQQFVRLLEAYEAEKAKRNVVDYDDLISRVTDLLETNPQFAQAQRWRFRHFFVDEFQDLNRAQFDLLRAWMGARNDLFVVGDPNQAIYEWNGADAGFLRDIRHHFPDVETVALGMNYRSTLQILRAAAAVLPEGRATRPEGDNGGTLTAANGPAPTVHTYVDERNEALSIARTVRKVHGSGRRWRDIAVLVRTNAQRRSLESAFNQLKIPFSSGAGAGWTQSMALRPAMALLNERRSYDLATVGPDIAEMAAEATEEDRALVERLERAVAHALDLDRSMKVADFVAWLEVSSRNDGPDGDSGVIVTTFHRAKGLEWPIVFVAGVDAALVPFGGMESATLDEERRLFYVAITRAREELHLSWAHERMGPRGVIECTASPWLEAIEAQSIDEPSNADAQSTVTNIREKLSVSNVDSSARGNLEQWRRRRALLMGVDPKLVLSDEMIEAIVTASPKSAEELAGVTGFGKMRASSMGTEVLAAMKSGN